jgi:polyribonucleotide nucleotidyltransferase
MESISEPRAELNQFAPRVLTIKIPTDKIRDIIGPGGKMIRSIIEATGAQIDVNDDGTVYIASRDKGGEEAVARIRMIIKEPEIGEKYHGRVVSIQPFGAFVELFPGKDGLLHISRVAKGRVDKVEDVLSIGDEIEVEIIDLDDKGKVSLGRIDPPDAPPSTGAPRPGGDRGPRPSGDRPHSGGGDRGGARRHH